MQTIIWQIGVILNSDLERSHSRHTSFATEQSLKEKLRPISWSREILHVAARIKRRRRRHSSLLCYFWCKQNGQLCIANWITNWKAKNFHANGINSIMRQVTSTWKMQMALFLVLREGPSELRAVRPEHRVSCISNGKCNAINGHVPGHDSISDESNDP